MVVGGEGVGNAGFEGDRACAANVASSVREVGAGSLMVVQVSVEFVESVVVVAVVVVGSLVKVT